MKSLLTNFADMFTYFSVCFLMLLQDICGCKWPTTIITKKIFDACMDCIVWDKWRFLVKSSLTCTTLMRFMTYMWSFMKSQICKGRVWLLITYITAIGSVYIDIGSIKKMVIQVICGDEILGLELLPNFMFCE